MSNDTTIRINPKRPSTQEFEVTVSGLEQVLPTVRFIIQNVGDGIDWMFKCKKLDDSKWQVSFPKLDNISVKTCKFYVEVIVDEYLFRAAEGDIEFITAPDISFKSPENKPKITTSFNKKDEVKPTVKESTVEESEITGMYAPTNSLLKPEENPEYTHGTVKTAQAEVDDQKIDKDVIDDISNGETTPGPGAPYAQDDGKDDVEDADDEEDNNIDKVVEFDPKKVAESIVKSALGSVPSPSKHGSLFNRGNDGKIIVPGLESKKQLEEKAIREQKIRDILK